MSTIIDQELERDSGVVLQLAAKLEGTHSIATRAEVQISQPAALKELLASTVEADKINIETARTKGITPTKPAPKQASRLVLNFALVQQTGRYNGENGFRFHRMVRAVAKPTLEGFPIALTGTSTPSFSFDPAAISKSLETHLTAFEQYTEKFGTAHFRMKDTTLPLDQLAVAAWVEDPKTHHVVATSFVPRQTQTQAAAR